jgi:hypothetical protein
MARSSTKISITPEVSPGPERDDSETISSTNRKLYVENYQNYNLNEDDNGNQAGEEVVIFRRYRGERDKKGRERGGRERGGRERGGRERGGS